MKMVRKSKVTRSVLTGVLAGIVLMSGVVVNPIKTEAAEDKVKYTQCNIIDGKAEIPVEKDYVFGGWYETAGSEKPLKDSVDTTSNTTVYAKMVPARVLSVKMQINSSAKEEDQAATTMRVLSSVDDTNYREVGFEVYLGNQTTEFQTDKVSTVYQTLTYTEDGKTQDITASDLFGASAGYLSAISLNGITDENDSSKIYVRPYWVTLDGTKVQGMARNLHVVDEFYDYISIPVNILSNVEVAAGQFIFSYDKDKYEIVEETGFEVGRIFGADDMDYKVYPSAGKIKVLGIASEIDSHVLVNGLLANIRFKAKNTESNPEGVILEVTEKKCADWSEEQQTVDVWNYNY